MSECTHNGTLLTEEGHECLLCGKVLGHSYKPPQRPWRRRSIGSGPHYPGDYAHVARCAQCREQRDDRPVECLSWDVYTVQP